MLPQILILDLLELYKTNHTLRTFKNSIELSNSTESQLAWRPPLITAFLAGLNTVSHIFNLCGNNEKDRSIQAVFTMQKHKSDIKALHLTKNC